MESKRRRVEPVGPKQLLAWCNQKVTSQTLELHVFLPSGRCEAVYLPLSSSVGDLKLAAQHSLGQRFLKLAAPNGCLLEPEDSLQSVCTGLQDGDTIAAVVQQPRIAATSTAFALWCSGGDRIVTWGNAHDGGNSTRVQDQLRKVQQICATHFAFAAIRHLLVVPPGPLPCEGEAKFSGSGSTYVVSTLYGDLAPLWMH